MEAVADIAVLDLKDSPVEFTDTSGHRRSAHRQFAVRHTIRAGAVWGAPTHPGLGRAYLQNELSTTPKPPESPHGPSSSRTIATTLC